MLTKRTCSNCNYVHVDTLDYPCSECINTEDHLGWEKYDPTDCRNEIYEREKQEAQKYIGKLNYAIYKLQKLDYTKEEIIKFVNNAFEEE